MAATKNKELHTVSITKDTFHHIQEVFEKAYGVKPQIGDFVAKAISEKLEKIEVASQKRGK
jgi:hypothetical protein